MTLIMNMADDELDEVADNVSRESGIPWVIEVK